LSRSGVRIEQAETELLLPNVPRDVPRRGNPSWNRFMGRCANISKQSQRPRICPGPPAGAQRAAAIVDRAVG